SLGRAGGLGPYKFRQLRRIAGAADALGEAPPFAPRARLVRHGGFRPLGLGSPSASRRAGGAGRRRSRRASRAHPVAPLWGRVLAPVGARGRLAAAVARSLARLSPAGGAR